MQAAIVDRYGVNGCRIIDREVESLASDAIEIATRFTSTDPVDVETLSGKNKLLLPVRPPFVLGVDVAGTVTAVGARVSGFKPGDRMAAYTGVPAAGAWAQRVVVPAAAAAPVPDAVPLEQAVARSLAGLAAWEAVRTLNVSGGQRVLVHGAAGSVGPAAAQIALAQGVEVLANVHSRHGELMFATGIEEVVRCDEQPFHETLNGLDGVVDTVGGDTPCPQC